MSKHRQYIENPDIGRMAEQAVCEFCPYYDKCRYDWYVNGSPPSECAIGEDHRKELAKGTLSAAFSGQTSGKILCDRIITSGMSDFLNRFAEKKEIFEQMRLSLPLTNENYIVFLEILDSRISAVSVFNRNALIYETLCSDPADMDTVSFPDIQSRAVQCNVIDRYYI